MPPREISIANRHPRLRFDRRAVARVIEHLDACFASPAKTARRVDRTKKTRPAPPRAAPPGELSVVFLTDSALARLHADFLADPTITDVITFEGDPLLGTAGEICVSADTADTFAAAHDRDFSEELTLYVVHGWLHLAGYDDLQPRKKRRMRAAEARAMKLLAAHDAIPAFRRR